MDPQRILITGSSGYFGRSLVDAIRAAWPSVEILGLDVLPPKVESSARFEPCDITSPKLREHIVQFQPDTILHLAFVVNPMRDEDRMHQINVEGTKNLLAAAAEVRARRVFVASSATAYGAWPDNPIPMTEDQPLRSREDYRYAADKAEVESLLSRFAAAYPEIIVSWARPSIIYGPGMSNFMIPLFTVPPLLTLPGGSNPAMQFVHLDDVSAATIAILNAEGRGPFNVAPPDWVTIKDLAKMSGKLALPVPFALCRAVTTCWWALRLPIFLFPAPLWNFIRYPWVVSPARLQEEVGYQFKYSSREVIQMLLKDAGKLKAR
jgi:UDP-glucose 4-epimerase